MESRGKFPVHKLAVMAALALVWTACAAGPRRPRTQPTPAAASERVGPWDITIALYEPALYGPERALEDLIGDFRLRLENGKLKGARFLAIKAQRRLELWVGRRMVKAYRVQLGIVSRGAKMRQGDRMTPEGEYFICAHSGSEYYLALWISYPNLADARRGLKEGLITFREFEEVVEALREGRCPPQRTRLGGDLLVHGQPREYAAELAASHRENPGPPRNGLKAGDTDPAIIKEFQDWTEGCIALFNPDIRELYEFVPDGTPIRIVADGPITPPRPAPRRKGQRFPG
ncbi:MAG: L,D-transpeptidase family protein [Candidatus Aminicenantes bacterium]|nr:L,D-transpeptidase family protein [Candidatus Aminicenantes bacterium]